MQRRTFLGLLPALVAGFKAACVKVKERVLFRCYCEEGRAVMDSRAIAGLDIHDDIQIAPVAQIDSANVS